MSARCGTAKENMQQYTEEGLVCGLWREGDLIKLKDVDGVYSTLYCDLLCYDCKTEKSPRGLKVCLAGSEYTGKSVEINQENEVHETVDTIKVLSPVNNELQKPVSTTQETKQDTQIKKSSSLAFGNILKSIFNWLFGWIDEPVTNKPTDTTIQPIDTIYEQAKKDLDAIPYRWKQHVKSIQLLDEKGFNAVKICSKPNSTFCSRIIGQYNSVTHNINIKKEYYSTNLLLHEFGHVVWTNGLIYDEQKRFCYPSIVDQDGRCEEKFAQKFAGGDYVEYT